MGELSFSSDRVKINGPKVDGGFTVTFEVGEYEQESIAKLLMIPQNKVIKVIVEVDD